VGTSRGQGGGTIMLIGIIIIVLAVIGAIVVIRALASRA
jgi:hypothetical protein